MGISEEGLIDVKKLKEEILFAASKLITENPLLLKNLEMPSMIEDIEELYEKKLFFGKIPVPSFESIKNCLSEPRWYSTAFYFRRHQIGVEIDIDSNCFASYGISEYVERFSDNWGKLYKIRYRPFHLSYPHMVLIIKKKSEDIYAVPELIVERNSTSYDIVIHSDYIPTRWYDLKGLRNSKEKIESLSENLDRFLGMVFNRDTIRR